MALEKKICKTTTGWRKGHEHLADLPHPSIPSVLRRVCTDCGKVITWLPR